MRNIGNGEHPLFRALPAELEIKVFMGCRSDGRGVVLKFDTQEKFQWMELTKEQALVLAAALQKCAAGLPEQKEKPT